ncbi:unnamed protein product [Ilex paraguariensis]|uniref:Uncharacterized protein n=1 Tax=Ilex paraguariensis TaxID=185542 RepID=A0ABC8SUZ5_9AQUA
MNDNGESLVDRPKQYQKSGRVSSLEPSKLKKEGQGVMPSKPDHHCHHQLHTPSYPSLLPSVPTLMYCEGSERTTNVEPIFQVHGDEYEAANTEVKASRKLLNAKRQEIDLVQSMINRVKNAIFVEDIDAWINNVEHMIEHETLPLKEEKQFIREIKQLKHLRGQLSSNMGCRDEVQQALQQKDQVEERLKILRKDLDCLKDKASKAEVAVVLGGKKYKDESKRLKELQAQFRVADDIRQQAYSYF